MNSQLEEEVVTMSAIRSCILEAVEPCVRAAEERHKNAILILTREVQGLRKELTELKKLYTTSAGAAPLVAPRKLAVDPLSEKVIPKEPFSSLKSFNDFEARLQADDFLFDQLETKLSDIPISNAKKFVKACWRIMLNDIVAERFSWRGTDNKQCARSLRTTAAIRNAFISKNIGQEEHFLKASISFFQFAKNRQKQRIEYKMKKSAANSKVKNEY